MYIWNHHPDNNSHFWIDQMIIKIFQCSRDQCRSMWVASHCAYSFQIAHLLTEPNISSIPKDQYKQQKKNKPNIYVASIVRLKFNRNTFSVCSFLFQKIQILNLINHKVIMENGNRSITKWINFQFDERRTNRSEK